MRQIGRLPRRQLFSSTFDFRFEFEGVVHSPGGDIYLHHAHDTGTACMRKADPCWRSPHHPFSNNEIWRVCTDEATDLIEQPSVHPASGLRRRNIDFKGSANCEFNVPLFGDSIRVKEKCHRLCSI
jgi:hypothetical protein